MSVPGKAVPDAFFTVLSSDTYRCNLFNHDYKVKGSGHTNLKSHVQSKHREALNYFEHSLKTGSVMDISKYKYLKKTVQIHAWV